jgi:thiaminase/transcriptional activator TenA
MSYTKLRREEADHLWEKEYMHPFVQGIGDGTLALEKFQHYMKQDYLFLIEFSKVISLAIAKSKHLDDTGWFDFAMARDMTLENSIRNK